MERRYRRSHLDALQLEYLGCSSSLGVENRLWLDSGQWTVDTHRECSRYGHSTESTCSMDAHDVPHTWRGPLFLFFILSGPCMVHGACCMLYVVCCMVPRCTAVCSLHTQPRGRAGSRAEGKASALGSTAIRRRCGLPPAGPGSLIFLSLERVVPSGGSSRCSHWWPRRPVSKGWL